MAGNPFLAEAYALCDGMTLAWKHKFKKLVCEVDCTDPITTLEDESIMSFHIAYPMLMDVKQLFRKDWMINSCIFCISNARYT